MATPTDVAPPSPTAARGRPADPQLQARFIQAALDLLTQQGYRAVTTAAIAASAGASTASLYRRWPTKRALVADTARTLTLDALGEIDTGTLPGDLRELIARKQRLFDRVGTALLALLAEAGHDEELREILREEVTDSTTARIGAMIERAVERGEILAPDEVTVRLLSLVVVGGGLLAQTLAPTGGAELQASAQAQIDAEVALILRGLGARP